MKLKIIAEAAQGFEGKYILAKKLMMAAIRAGSDCIKYQLVYADELCTRDYVHYKLFKSLELKDQQWKSLKNLSKNNKIELQFDIFGPKSLELSEKLGIKTIKIHPTDISNNVLLDLLSKSKIKNIILGIGGAHYNEIIFALKKLQHKKIILMFGFQNYPTPTEKNQLQRINLLKKKLSRDYKKKIQYGFADHEYSNTILRYLIPATAVGIGFTLIEKHITLKTKRKLEDSETALYPKEFKIFCNAMRKSFQSLGDYKDDIFFGMSKEELNYRKVVRRHVLASKNLEKGHILKGEDLILKRSPEKKAIKDISLVIGKKLRKKILKDGIFTNEYLV
jgi:sialic acid synthase SpsE